MDAKIIFKENTLFSEAFDDLYFSKENGREESKYVFIEGNSLPKRFQACKEFRIAEFGFGTGLNFLLTIEEWLKAYENGKVLNYVSIEKFPLTPDQIVQSLENWPDLKVELIIDSYSKHVPGLNIIEIKEYGIKLFLIIDDIAKALKSLPDEIDCWFLDGFAPKKNPEMWSEQVFNSMSEMSKDGATFATFTAASFVRRSLVEAGFEVAKKKGFGRKREMLVGSSVSRIRAKKNFEYAPWYQYPKVKVDKKKAIVIGAGIAGCAAANFIAKEGWEVAVYEKGSTIANQASGNPYGIIYPRIEAEWSAISKFYYFAYKKLSELLSNTEIAQKVSFNKCGLLVLQESLNAFEKLKDSNILKNIESYAKIVSATESSKLAGIPINQECLYLEDSGYLSIPKLCEHFISSSDKIVLKLNTNVDKFYYENDEWMLFDDKNSLIDKAPVLIIASAYDKPNYKNLDFFRIKKIRGQISFLEEIKDLRQLKTVLCYGGYLTPNVDGMHHLGATYDKDDFSSNINEDSHIKNLSKLNKSIHKVPVDTSAICGGRAAIRAYSDDTLPLIGPVPSISEYEKLYGDIYKVRRKGDYSDPAYDNGLYISVGHGSRGILSSIAAAHIFANHLSSKPGELEKEVIDLIHPARFLIRSFRKR